MFTITLDDNLHSNRIHTHSKYSTHTCTQYVVKEDFHPPPLSLGEATLSLKKGDIVEVLDDSIDGKWFIRAQPVTSAGKMDHGWVPSSLLEKLDTDSTDGKKGWVQLGHGPLSGGSSDDDKWKALRQNQTGFGSHDIQRQQVIIESSKVALCSFRTVHL